MLAFRSANLGDIGWVDMSDVCLGNPPIELGGDVPGSSIAIWFSPLGSLPGGPWGISEAGRQSEFTLQPTIAVATFVYAPRSKA